MKLGVISDVHGDLIALNKALDALRDTDFLVCAGDLVDIGAEVEGVIDLMRRRAIPCVQGNHDLEASQQGFAYVTRNERYGIEKFASLDLSDDTRAFLRTLPFALDFEWGGQRVHITHTAPWDQNFEVTANNEDALRRVAAAANADMVILGHTHRPMQVKLGNCLILNPGCVYYGWPEYHSTAAILSLPDGDFQVIELDSGQKLTIPRREW